MKKMSVLNIAVTASCGLLILCGLWIFCLGARNIWRAISSTSWPTTTGTVITSSVEVDTTYNAIIAVQFHVNGRDYTTDRIRFGETLGSGDSSEAELRQRRYPADATVKVSYNPNDPSIAAMKTGLHSEVMWLPGAGLAFILPGLMSLLFFSGGRTSPSAGAAGAAMFAAIFAGIGIAMLVAGGLRLWRAHASESWPQTPGMIVYENENVTRSTKTGRTGRTGGSTSYGAALVYQYKVNGETHISNVRQFGQLAGSGQDWAEAIIQQYPKGKEIPVSYSPDDPDLAVLQPGISSEAYWLPGAGLAFLVFASMVAFIIVPAIAKSPF